MSGIHYFLALFTLFICCIHILIYIFSLSYLLNNYYNYFIIDLFLNSSSIFLVSLYTILTYKIYNIPIKNIVAGIYVLSPSVLINIPLNVKYGMDELILGMLSRKESIQAYQLTDYWVDVGRFESLSEAQELSEIQSESTF